MANNWGEPEFQQRFQQTKTPDWGLDIFILTGGYNHYLSNYYSFTEYSHDLGVARETGLCTRPYQRDLKGCLTSKYLEGGCTITN